MTDLIERARRRIGVPSVPRVPRARRAARVRPYVARLDRGCAEPGGELSPGCLAYLERHRPACAPAEDMAELATAVCAYLAMGVPA